MNILWSTLNRWLGKSDNDHARIEEEILRKHSTSGLKRNRIPDDKKTKDLFIEEKK